MKRSQASMIHQDIPRQWSGRRSLKRTVRGAVDTFFQFQYRSPRSQALWCETHRVWLGYQTFIYWALCDGDIDVPRLAAKAVDAPGNAGDLREAVRAELKAYWTKLLSSLPREVQPLWLPLP